jgi:hypothetical protein
MEEGEKKQCKEGSRAMRKEEARKGESGARVKLEPHFILDLRFLFFRSNGSTHNNFSPCNSLH